MFLVGWMDFLHGLQFHDHLAFNDQIVAKAFLESLSLIFDWNTHLALDGKPSLLQLSGQRHFVDSLKQPRAKAPMQMHSTVNDQRPYFILMHLRAPVSL